MTEFEGVVPALGQALAKRGYLELTQVQNAVLAPELGEADLLVSAQTGSGKTVAFGLALAPMLLAGEERFDRTETPLALVVAPTRELALQVTRELAWLYEAAGASVVSCVGGMDMRTERRALERGADIVIGTPGRLCDHIKRRSLDMSNLKAVVLDEADEMLDLGFREELEAILDAAPDERRTLMFSATVPRSIANLAGRYQRDAVRVATTAEQSQHLDIEYRAITVAPDDQENAVINLLRYYEARNALVFCSTRATVNHLTSRFANRGFKVVALSGEFSQGERSHALQALRDGRAKVCVATDVAARGIDLPDLELVIHADIPKNRESLLHRSGRTGRAGRKGVSVLIVPCKARKRTERLFQNARIEVAWAKPPSADDIMRRDDERIMADPVLSETVTDTEAAFAKRILAGHSAERIAAAFVRLYRAGQSAPEELMDIAAPKPAAERKSKQRDDFSNGVWFSLSVGRKHSAEARWLLPMLYGAGDLNKREIGAIRVRETETLVELAPRCVEGFLKTLGPDQTPEKTIVVKQLDRAPEGIKDAGPGASVSPRKADATRKAHSGPKPESKRPFKTKPDQALAEEKLKEVMSDKHWDAPGKKPRHKKLKKPKPAKLAVNSTSATKPVFKARKRLTLKKKPG